MPEQESDSTKLPGEGGGSVVFGDQPSVLRECGLEITADASLRPLLTIGCRSKKALAVVFTRPGEGPSIDELAPWLEASSGLVEHMEDQSA